MSSYSNLTIDYNHNGTDLEAYAAIPSGDKKQIVLICHAWAGRDQFVIDMANKLANHGYVGVALDVYGKGILGDSVDEKMALMQPLLDNRAELQARLQAGLDSVISQDFASSLKVSAVGYCFGGLCVLDMARMGLELDSVISVHGLFNKPDNLNNYAIKSRVLALHGHLDPMVKPDAVSDFMQELDKAKADWQINTYGKALHAFTNPEANDYELGTVYNEDVAMRAWHSILDFLG